MRGKKRIVICSDPDDLAREAAERVMKIGRTILRRRRIFRVVLSGGSTPRRLYRSLAGDPYRSDLPWDRVHFFWGDERCVDPDHPESNYRAARETLLDSLSVRPENIHRMRGEAPDPDAAAREYETEIRGHFDARGKISPPAFDLVLLGMGPDGHTASLFPGTDVLKETSRWVAAGRSPQPPYHRLTMTLPLLNAASHILILVTGDAKAKTVAEALEGADEGDPLPARMISPVSGRLVWLLDRAAASALKKSKGRGRR